MTSQINSRENENTIVKERILGYQLSELFSIEVLQSISGGSKKNGTRNACVEATHRNGTYDTQADINYDW